ncbi:MAG: hypothetical protein COB85_01155 [Bacteroidetes bacterium]|nr:MAG: hypothetical protein COB85_01155 [Bacteroidota bacterium]
MWVKKTEEELSNNVQKRRFGAREFVGFTIVAVALVAVVKSIGLRGWRPGALPMKWQDIMEEVPYDLIGVSVIIFVMFVIILKRGMLDHISNSNSCICMKCSNPQESNSDMKCNCGGELEFTTNLKWIPDDD